MTPYRSIEENYSSIFTPETMSQDPNTHMHLCSKHTTHKQTETHQCTFRLDNFFTFSLEKKRCAPVQNSSESWVIVGGCQGVAMQFLGAISGVLSVFI